MRRVLLVTFFVCGCVHKVQPTPEQTAAAEAAERAEAQQRVQADCDEAQRTRAFSPSLQCGDNFQAAGDIPSAIAWWRVAYGSAPSRDQACVPVMLIYRNSPQPTRDLAGVDPVLAHACAQGERDKREEKMVASQQEQNCENTCESSRALCAASASPTDLFGKAGCNLQFRSCRDDCRDRYH